MARSRNIKPSFFKNELLVEMGPFDRLLFVGLWCLADREGRVEDRPKRIKMELFPCDSYEVDQGLNDLQRHGFVKRYEAAGFRVVSILNFTKHQTPHGTEKDSELPDESGEFTVHERTTNGYVTGQKRKNNVISEQGNGQQPLGNSAGSVKQQGDNTLNPDSRILNPDSLIPKHKREKSPVSGLEERFDTFWKAYPKKTAKDDARKAFAKRKPDAAMLENMLAALEVQSRSPAWTKEGGQFIPNPATWLNGGRWQDGEADALIGGSQVGAFV